MIANDKLEKHIKYFDFVFFVSDVAEWIDDQWRDLGPAAVGLDPSDLERINLDSLEEMLDDFGTYNFSKSQAKALIEAAKKAWDESGKFDLCLFSLFFFYTVSRMLEKDTLLKQKISDVLDWDTLYRISGKSQIKIPDAET